MNTKVYANELIKPFKGDAKTDTIRENFEVVIDDIKFVLDFFISHNFWEIDISHNWIREWSNEDILLSFIHKNEQDDKGFFPEFIDGNLPTVEIVEMFLNRIISLLETLKFDKKSGHLRDKHYIRLDIARRCCFGKFMKSPDSEKCSVCLDDEIQSKTPCGHTLCYACWSKLESKPICPICRACICYTVKL